MGNQGPLFFHQGVKQAALPDIRGAGQDDPALMHHFPPTLHLRGNARDLFGGGLELPAQVFVGEELNVFVDKVQARFQVGEQL